MASVVVLVLSIGITGGALFGLPAVVLLPIITIVVVGLARQPVILLAGAMLLGALAGHARVAMQDQPYLGRSILTADRIEGIVVSIPQIGPSGQRATIDVVRVRDRASGAWAGGNGRLLVFFRDTVSERVLKGDRVQITGTVQALAGVERDFARFVRSEQAAGVAYADTTSIRDHGSDRLNVIVHVQEAITNSITSALPGDNGGLLAGFVTGDDSGLSDTAREAFERTNTSHITAVSGGNVAILLAMWGLIVPAGRWRRHILVQVTIVISIWAYVGLVGFGPASLRAALFATLLVPAARMGRRGDPMTALMIASAILLLVKPELADSVGYWLSLAASMAMITVVTPGEGMILRIPMGLVAAQFATLPLTLLTFGEWSPVSFIANLMVGPMVASVMPVAFVTAVILQVPVVGVALAWIPGMGATVILACVRSLSADFSVLQGGPALGASVLLVALFSATVIGGISVDVHRWLSRIEHANRDRGGHLPAILAGAVAGGAIGIIGVVMIQAAGVN